MDALERAGASTIPEHLKDAPPTALIHADQAVGMFERLATNPDVDVAKLERLIAMQERILEHNARAAFNAAFVQMQSEIPTVIEKASTDKTTYAPLEDIVDAVRPILSRHGFSLSFKTDWPEGGKRVRVMGILTHDSGHARESEFLSDPDTTGSKNAIQAQGSAVSYGRRYTTTDLLCIVTRRQDDDGNRANAAARPRNHPPAPAGYDEWLADLEAVADEGMARFEPAWHGSKEEYRKYLQATAPKLLAQIKTKAAKNGTGRR